jgi:hypothetical protein
MAAEPKTKATGASVADYMGAIENETQRDDAKAIHDMMKSVTGKKGVMWGSAIIGFGTYHYVYADGKEGDWPLLAFSPRKQHNTLYVGASFKDKEKLLKKLGKYKMSGGCLHIKKLADVDEPTLKIILEASYKENLKKRK